jgi:beta-lactamase regulating signal transducer with metallopeptidase domain
LVGAVVMAIRLCLGLWEIRHLRRSAFLIADGRWDATLRSVAARLGLRRAVLLRGTIQCASPVMIGVLRPMILVPLSMLSGLAPEQVEVILAHELTHVQRHDYLANLLQLVIETLLFYGIVA